MKKNFIKLFMSAAIIANCMQLNAQTGNTKTGTNAGKSITTGSYNTLNGYTSGYSVTTGSSNTMSGAYSGYNSTTGKENVFVGLSAGWANQNGNGNSYVGYKAGSSASTSESTGLFYNSFFGYKAGANATAGFSSGKNTYIGAFSGENSHGSVNTFIGYESGQNNGGTANILIGLTAGNNNDGDYNLIMGTSSGKYNEGDYNVFLGGDAGEFNTGNYNIMIGLNSGERNNGEHNIFMGKLSGYYNETGSANLFLGYCSGLTNLTGSYNVCLGYEANVNFDNLTNATAIGYAAEVSASNSLVLGNNANVGIGTSAPAYQLQLSSDNAAKAGTSTWTIASDQRLKKDITDFTDGLSVLQKIHPVWFSYNGEAGMPTDKKFVGIIAQEVKEIAPYMVGTFNSQDTLGNKTEYLDYDANALFYILVNSVKEQQQTITQLKEQMARMEKLLESKNSENNDASGIEDISACCDASLEQNFPNPFNESTIIKYAITGKINSAAIVISSIDGKELKRYTINESTSGQLTIPAHTFSAGAYFYQLIIDGIAMDSKKMEIIR